LIYGIGSAIHDVRFFRETDCGTDWYLLVEVVRMRPLVSKRKTWNFAWADSLSSIYTKCRFEILTLYYFSKIFAALENSDDSGYISGV